MTRKRIPAECAKWIFVWLLSSVSCAAVMGRIFYLQITRRYLLAARFPPSSRLYYHIDANAPNVEAGAIAVLVEKFYRDDYSAQQVPIHSVSLVRGPGFRRSGEYRGSVSRNDYKAYNTENASSYKLRVRFHAWFNSWARTDEPAGTVRPRYVFSRGDGFVCDQTVYLFHYRHVNNEKNPKSNTPTDIPFDVPVFASHVRGTAEDTRFSRWRRGSSNWGMGVPPMREFLEELRDSSLFYWADKPASGKVITALLSGNAILIVLARSIFHGWDEALVSVIATLSGFLMLAMACIGALLRPGSDMPDDAYKLGRAIAIVWLLSLALISPGILPPLRDFFSDIAPWALAAIIAGIATALFTGYSVSRSRNRSLNWKLLIVPALFVGVTTWLFFGSIIVDEATDEFFRDSKTTIENLFRRQ